MPVVPIPDPHKYDKAVGILIRSGGAFSGREPQALLVSPSQYRELVKAGLVNSGLVRNASSDKRRLRLVARRG